LKWSRIFFFQVTRLTLDCSVFYESVELIGCILIA